MGYSAERGAERVRVREHKDEDKRERKNMYVMPSPSQILSHSNVPVSTLSSSKSDIQRKTSLF